MRQEPTPAAVYSFTPGASMNLAKGDLSMQGGLFLASPYEMIDADCAAIFNKAYR